MALSLGLTAAITASAADYQSEFDKKIKASQRVGALGNNVAGDQVNFYTGSTSFAATDVSVPGTGLGISIGRSYTVEPEHQLAAERGATIDDVVYSTRQRAFGDWDMDVPYISTVMTQSSGWIVDSGTPTNRCSVVGQTGGSGNTPVGAPPYATITQYAFEPAQYWSGYTLHAGGDQTLLVAPSNNTQRPSTGGPYHWTTNKDWWLSCLSSLASPVANGTGQGFMAVGPDGTKYTFNWLSKRNINLISSRTETDPIGGGYGMYHRLHRAEYFMLPTRIEDRFGNYLQFTWSNDAFARLTKIESFRMDQPATAEQTVTLQYNAAGYVSTITHGTRTWTYTYSGDSLTQVTLPDSSSWQISLAGLNGIVPFTPNCPYGDATDPQWHWACFGGGWGQEPEVGGSGYIVHPSGARVDFSFASHFQYSRDEFYASHPVGLVSKTVSGPGLVTATWKYAHLPSQTAISNACQAGTCPTRIMTDELAPDGSLTRRIYGVQSQVDLGQLLGVVEGSTSATAGGGSPAITTTALWGVDPLDDASPTSGSVPTFFKLTSYEFVPASHTPLYLVKVGDNPLLSPAGEVPVQTFIGERRLPVARTTQVLQGTTFKRDTPYLCGSGTQVCFDAYGLPTRQALSSTGGAGGNFSRTQKSYYETTTSPWVVGQLVWVNCSGNTDCATDKVIKRTQYNTARLPWKIYGVDQVNPEATLTYNANGTLATAADGLSHVTTLSGYKFGVPTALSFPDTGTLSADVGPKGEILWTISQVGSGTCYGYDAMGRLNTITYPSETATNTCNTTAWNPTVSPFDKVTVAEYGIPANHWRRTTSTGNGQTVVYYDAMWRPVLTLTWDSALPASKSFVVNRYDALGRNYFTSYAADALASVDDPLQGTWTEYDALGRVTKVTQDSELAAPYNATKTEYLIGFQTRVTNPRQYATTTRYQVFDTPSTDAPVRIEAPETAVTDITRQPSLGKPLYITRSGTYDGAAVSAVRAFVYDANERLCKTINPESGATVADYDLAGNVLWTAQGQNLPAATCDRASVPAAQWTQRTYDEMNRVKTVTTTSHEADITTTYELDGLVKTLVANNKLTGFSGGLAPVTTTYTYNRRRLMTQEDSSQPQDAAVPAYTYSSTYGYDANGHLSTFTYPDGFPLGYLPDALGRPTKVGALATGITYYPNGAIKGFTYGNGIVHTMTQNARRLPGRSQDLRGAAAVLDDTYAYDANGNVTSISDSVVGGVTSRTMSYDGLDRLISANSTGQWGTATYAYDPMDNLRIADIGGASARQFRYNYDANNRLATLKNPAGATLYTFGYDGRGNQTAKGSQAYTFDIANRLASVVNKESYRYDGLGRRVSARTAVTMLWTYTQDGRQTFATDGRRSQNRINVYLGNTLVATRTWDFGSGVINWRYVHTDALGSPIWETDAAGTVVKFNKYEPYGAAYGAGTSIDGIGYTGHVMDQATGLTYMQQRFYDGVSGRFLSVDPVSVNPNTGALFNRYAYANNNPYRFTDPDGRAPAGCGSGKCNEKTPEEKARSEAARARMRALSDGGLARAGSRPSTAPITPVAQKGDYPTSNPSKGQEYQAAAAVGPYDAYTAKGAANQGRISAGRSGLPGARNGPQDAMRHCTAACNVASDLGAAAAVELGDIHEAWYPGPAVETHMDMFNNRFGAEHQKSGQSCPVMCREAVDAGQLEVRPQNEWVD